MESRQKIRSPGIETKVVGITWDNQRSQLTLQNPFGLACLAVLLTAIQVGTVEGQRRRPLRRPAVPSRQLRVPAYEDAEPAYGPPEPFEFTYASQDEEGTHTHSQQGDASGRVEGEYEIQLADGRNRLVK